MSIYEDDSKFMGFRLLSVNKTDLSEEVAYFPHDEFNKALDEYYQKRNSNNYKTLKLYFLYNIKGKGLTIKEILTI